jgi:hypothetical protein
VSSKGLVGGPKVAALEKSMGGARQQEFVTRSFRENFEYGKVPFSHLHHGIIDVEHFYFRNEEA